MMYNNFEQNGKHDEIYFIISVRKFAIHGVHRR